jgi:hypothetical protein
VIPFTGPHAGSPWWQDTFAVLVSGSNGVINYGEIRPRPDLKAGLQVKEGELLGEVITVLTKDKGRPMTMLHLELYSAGSSDVVEWKCGAPKPESLQDPTSLLLASAKLPPLPENSRSEGQ